MNICSLCRKPFNQELPIALDYGRYSCDECSPQLNTCVSCGKKSEKIYESFDYGQFYCDDCGKKLNTCILCGEQFEKELNKSASYKYEHCDNCAKIMNCYIEETLRSIPQSYRQCTLQNYNKTPGNAYALSKLFENEVKLPLYFYGKPRVGKTHLSVALLKKVSKRNNKCKFVNVTYLMAQCRMASGDKYSQTADELINGYIYDPECLLIDDIGIEYRTDFVREKMYMLIDGRYSNKKPTIITSNYSLAEIADRLGERIASRVGSGTVLEITGEDYRLSHHKVVEENKTITNKTEVDNEKN